LSGFSGWTSATFGPIAADYDLGETSLFAVKAGLASLSSDGEGERTRADDLLIAIGSTAGRAMSNGATEFRGTAWRLWLNGRLLNKSRWEELPTEWQIALLGWIGAIAWFFMRVSKPVFGRLACPKQFHLL
jgi:hypothetical protein